MKIIIVGAYPESLINFRGDLIKDLIAHGHEVIAMATYAEPATIESIEALGCRFYGYPVQRSGMNPFSDIKTLRYLMRVFRSEQPDSVIAYTIKPVIWGGIAARLVGNIRFFAMITGLGFAFQNQGLKRKVLSAVAIRLYKSALKKATTVIFQNKDNQQVFLDNKITTKKQVECVHGSGVNLVDFSRTPLPNGAPVFLLIARLLGDKGLREYRQAAAIVKQAHPEAEFQIVGPEDPSPDGITMNEVLDWQKQGDICYLGAAKDVRPFINQCHVFVLPSYHEGMPRTVLEAMAIGRPVLTTNVPGCKETVTDGENGFLVPKADAQALAEKMTWMIEHQAHLGLMADKSYERAVQRYDVRQVNKQLIAIMSIDTDINDIGFVEDIEPAIDVT